MNSILTLGDQPLYFPCLELAAGQLTSAIYVATAKAEGPMGAYRKLAISRWEETPIINGALVQLSYWPIVKTQEGSPDLAIEVLTADGYEILPSSSYEVDLYSGEIQLLDGAIEVLDRMAGVRHSFGRRCAADGYGGVGMSYGGFIPNPFPHPGATEFGLRVKYKAGWDFSEGAIATDSAAASIKAMLAELVIATEESKSTLIKKESLGDFKSIEYSSASHDKHAAEILETFKQYRPRSTF